MTSSTALLSVGTTRFDDLIRTVLSPDVSKALVHRGFGRLVVQYGQSKISDSEWKQLKANCALDLRLFSLLPSLQPEIVAADLVISHAGAGTCIEVLSQGKPMVAVINEDLMHNHQRELAEKLAAEGHLKFCTCLDLKSTLEAIKFEDLTPWPKPHVDQFKQFLDDQMQAFFAE